MFGFVVSMKNCLNCKVQQWFVKEVGDYFEIQYK